MHEIELHGLTDDALRQRLKDLAAAERRITATLLLHLAEYDRRGLYVADGFAHLWDYCERVLHLGANQIKLRIQAARALRDNPRLREMLERGETTVTSIGRLAPHLDAPGAGELIEQARNKTQLEVRSLVAGIEVSKRVLAEREAESRERQAAPLLLAAQAGLPSTGPVATDCSAYVRERERDSIVPVSGTDFRVSFIAEEALIRNLQRVRALLARPHPQARLEDVLGALCELFLAKADPLRRAQARRERAARGRAAGATRAARGHIAASARDAVLERYGSRCAFEGAEGRCPEIRRLELDHIVPVALGGTDDESNLRPACPRHNRFLAILAFGAAYIERAIRRRREGGL
jgi:5-methylcytosine-specific restriction endonuclease McrA